MPKGANRPTVMKSARKKRSKEKNADPPLPLKKKSGAKGTVRQNITARKSSSGGKGRSPEPERERPAKRGGKEAHDGLDALWKEYKKTGSPEIRNILIEKHMPLVRKISERLLMTLPKSIELNDLVSWGIFGLMDAIDGFDLKRGIKFKTYCSTRIRGAILDELRSQDWVPRLVRLKAHQINKAWRSLEKRHGREPTDYEMARELKMSIEEYGNLLKESAPKAIFSLNEKWDENKNDDSLEKMELVEDKNSSDPVEFLNQKDIMMAITRSLSRKEKLIIIMYYYEGLTMKEIGSILNLTESRVCQIHSNIVSKLKVQLDKVRQKLMT